MDTDKKPQSNINKRTSRFSRPFGFTSHGTRSLPLQDSFSSNQSNNINNNGVDTDTRFLSIYELKEQRNAAKGKPKKSIPRKLTVSWSLSNIEAGLEGHSEKGRRKSSFAKIRNNYNRRKSTYKENVNVVPKPPSLLKRLFCIGAIQRRKSSGKMSHRF